MPHAELPERAQALQFYYMSSRQLGSQTQTLIQNITSEISKSEEHKQPHGHSGE